MGQHIAAIFIKNQVAGAPHFVLEILGFPPQSVKQIGESVLLDSYERSDLRHESVASALVDGWTVVWGRPLFRQFSDAQLSRLSELGWLIYLIVEDTSGTYGFSLYTDGVVKRRWYESEGEVIVDEGGVLAQEDERDEGLDTDWRVIRVVEKLSLTFERLYGARWGIYRVEGEKPAASRWQFWR